MGSGLVAMEGMGQRLKVWNRCVWCVLGSMMRGMYICQYWLGGVGWIRDLVDSFGVGMFGAFIGVGHDRGHGLVVWNGWDSMALAGTHIPRLSGRGGFAGWVWFFSMAWAVWEDIVD